MHEGKSQLRILVVEDEANVARALREGLEREKYEVVVATKKKDSSSTMPRNSTSSFWILCFPVVMACTCGLVIRQNSARAYSLPCNMLRGISSCHSFQMALNFGEPHHKDGDVWAWFDANRHWLEVHQLPPSSPELNPTERLWRCIRQTGSHNRQFPNEKELSGTLSRVFGEMQSYPELIRPYLQSFL